MGQTAPVASQDMAGAAAQEHPTRAKSAWYSTYVLVLIGLVAALNYYDRNLITILIEPIKRDLRLTDAQIGLLSGIGFALMYSVLGIPMAMLADRFGRARVVGGVVAVWSVMTILSGRTVNFTTMLMARAGVGVGEAGGLPASHAIIADRFSDRARGKALASIGVFSAFGLTLALALGGLINDWGGWRMAFYLGGAPGLVVAPLVFLTVREAKPETIGKAGPSLQSRPLGDVFAALWRRKAYVFLCVGMGVAAIGAYGAQTWSPAFLMRTYHLTAGQVGARYSAVVGPATLLSILLGGLVNDWLVRRDKRWPLWLLAFCFGVTLPATLFFLWVHNLALILGMSVITTVVGGLWIAPAYALVQALAGPPLRAMAAAIFMMIVNIIGLGLGPVIVGQLSDVYAPRFGAGALGMSLATVSATYVVGVIFFLLATRTLVADLATAEAA